MDISLQVHPSVGDNLSLLNAIGKAIGPLAFHAHDFDKSGWLDSMEFGRLAKVLRGPAVKGAAAATADVEPTSFRGLDENKDDKLTVGELSPFIDAVLAGL